MLIGACEPVELENTTSPLSSDPSLENVIVRNGELHFTNPETYFDDVKKIMELNEIELDRWESDVGFKSMRSLINEANEAFGNLKSKDQIPAWQEKYKNVVSIQDSIIVPHVVGNFYQTITNLSGEYVIGEAYVKILPDKLIMIKDGDRSRISEVMTLEKTPNDDNIVIKPLMNKEEFILRSNVNCPNSNGVNNNRKNGKKRVYLNFLIWENSDGYLSETVVEMEVYGRKKILGTWHVYATRHHAESVNFEVIDNDGIPKSLASDFSFLTPSGYQYQHSFHYFHLGDVTNHYTLTNPVFEKLKGRATTRGTDKTWVVTCCGGFDCPASEGDSPFSD